MVYRGKPSTACHACRKRRIKCDEVPLPRGCSSCFRAGMVCSGYRNVVDAMFVDQTRKVISKQRKCIPYPRSRICFTVSAAELGMAYFFSIHVLHASPSSNVTCTSVGESCLTTCMQALGLAAYATVTAQTKKLDLARAFYVDAISGVNAALRSEKQSKDDATLFAVVLLAYFEAIVGGAEDETSLNAWSKHISGTAALIESRGVEQMQSAEGRMLFLIATTNMISNCTRLTMRIPAIIHTIWKSALDHVSTSDPIWRCHSAWLKLVDFYSDVVHKRVEPSGIVPEALVIDQQLAQAFTNASNEWMFEVIPADHSEFEAKYLPSFVHCYKNSLSAQIWTSVRNGRLILHSIAAKTLWYLSLAAPKDSTNEMIEQIRISSKVIQAMKLDILATVPQQLGIGPFATSLDASPGSSLSSDSPATFQDTASALSPPSSTQASGLLVLHSNRLPILRTSRGYNFIWSLVLLVKLVPMDESLRAQLCHYMRLGGRKLGMQQAFTLAELIETGNYS